MSNEGERFQLSVHLAMVVSLLPCTPLVCQNGSVIKAL